MSKLDLSHVVAECLGPAAIDPPRMALPVGLVPTRLGFPSPAEDFHDDDLDLNEYVVRNPLATFFYRARGSSMSGAGICSGDVLAVDRSITPQHGDIVIASWDGNAPVCKVLHLRADGLELRSCPQEAPHILLGPEVEVEVFAVVGVIRQSKRSASGALRLPKDVGAY